MTSNKCIAIRTELDFPRMVVNQDTAMLARNDGFVLTSRIPEANIDLLAGRVIVIHDATVETVVFVRFPSRIVEGKGVLSGSRQMALEAAETFFWQKATAVMACFVTQRYDVPFFEHA